jgi:hypothetical protein
MDPSFIMDSYNTASSFYIIFIEIMANVSLDMAAQIAHYLLNPQVSDGIYIYETHDKERKTFVERLSALSKLSRHHEPGMIMEEAFKNRYNWEDYEDEEFVSYLERVEYLLSEGVHLYFVFEFAEEYKEMEHLHQLVSLVHRGVNENCAGLMMTNHFSPMQIEEFFQFVQHGFDQNDSFDCINEFHKDEETKHLVYELFNNDDIPDKVAFDVVFNFYEEPELLKMFLVFVESGNNPRESFEHIMNDERQLPSRIL